jgi:hypothetical protein
VHHDPVPAVVGAGSDAAIGVDRRVRKDRRIVGHRCDRGCRDPGARRSAHRRAPVANHWLLGARRRRRRGRERRGRHWNSLSRVDIAADIAADVTTDTAVDVTTDAAAASASATATDNDAYAFVVALAVIDTTATFVALVAIALVAAAASSESGGREAVAYKTAAAIVGGIGNLAPLASDAFIFAAVASLCASSIRASVAVADTHAAVGAAKQVGGGDIATEFCKCARLGRVRVAERRCRAGPAKRLHEKSSVRVPLRADRRVCRRPP